MSRIFQHLAATQKTLANAKLFCIATILMIAVILALVSTVVSLNNILLFKSLPYPNAGQLIDVRAAIASPGQTVHGNTTALAEQWRQDLADLGQFETSLSSIGKLRIGNDDQRIAVNYVSAGFFQMLGASAATGATLSQIDPNERKTKVLVLSAALAQRLFSNGKNAIDAHVSLDGENYRVVGVMPASFQSPRALRGAEDGVWLPFELSGMPLNLWNRFSSNLEVIARLKHQAAPEVLNQRIGSLTTALMDEHAKGQMPPGFRVTGQVSSLREAVVGKSTTASVVVLIATLLLALLGLSVVSTLWLARIARRRRVLALHTVLGAHFSDLVVAVALEVVLLFFIAMLLAIPLAFYFVGMVKLLGAASLPRLAELEINASFMILLLILMSLSAIVVSWLAVRRLKRLDIIEELRSASKGQLGTLQLAARKTILTLQLFFILAALWLACLLLIDAGKRLLIGPGFNETGASLLQVELPDAMQSLAAKADFELQLTRSLREHGYAKSIALIDMPPLSRALALRTVKEITGETIAQMQVGGVGGTYLRDIGLQLLAGRFLTEADRQESAKVLVVGQSAARLIGKGQSPLGKQVQISKETFEVVGVVNDVINPVQTHVGASLQGYIPFQHFDGPPTLTMMLFHPDRASPPKADLVKLLSAIEATLVLDEYEPIEALRSELVSNYYTIAKLAIVLAVLTLAMAISGVVAVINYLFYATSASIATRLALGANMRDLVGGLLRILHWPAMIASAALMLLVAISSQKLAGIGDIAHPLVLQTAAFALALGLLSAYGVGVGCARRLIRIGYRALIGNLH